MRAASRRPLTGRRRHTASLVGVRMLAARIEVWHDRPFRLHGRVAATLKGGGWEKARLYP